MFPIYYAQLKYEIEKRKDISNQNNNNNNNIKVN